MRCAREAVFEATQTLKNTVTIAPNTVSATSRRRSCDVDTNISRARLSQSRRFGMERGNVALRLKLVPHAPHRLEMPRPRRIGFDLRTQPSDVHRNGRRLARKLVIPDGSHQLVARKHLVLVRREVKQ